MLKNSAFNILLGNNYRGRKLGQTNLIVFQQRTRNYYPKNLMDSDFVLRSFHNETTKVPMKIHWKLKSFESRVVNLRTFDCLRRSLSANESLKCFQIWNSVWKVDSTLVDATTYEYFIQVAPCLDCNFEVIPESTSNM